MKRTGIVFSTRYLDHNPGFGHPESPLRLKAIMRGIKQSMFFMKENCSLIKPRFARIRDIELVHDSGYISRVKGLSEREGGLLGEYTVTSRESFQVARLAIGGGMEAVDNVMSGEFRNVFVLSRPPGHHAGPSYALGFCIFNVIALAAQYLLQNFGLERIVILDIDSHHGNGTQEVFYGVDEVLYISLHEDPSEFPETGFMRETGEGKGLGYTVNIPLPFKTGDSAYWKAIKSIVTPIVKEYSPQFLLVSAGFDGYYMDSVGELSLSAYIYPAIFETILDLAHHYCNDKIVAVLEGGYRLGFLKTIVPVIVGRMAGLNVRIHDKRPFINVSAEKNAEKVIEKVRRVQSCFWGV